MQFHTTIIWSHVKYHFRYHMSMSIQLPDLKIWERQANIDIQRGYGSPLIPHSFPSSWERSKCLVSEATKAFRQTKLLVIKKESTNLYPLSILWIKKNRQSNWWVWNRYGTLTNYINPYHFIPSMFSSKLSIRSISICCT